MRDEIKELMQISVINENTLLSNMIKDIEPLREKRFTDIELEVNKNETFSLVIYQKPTLFSKFWSKIKLSLEKFNILKMTKQYAKNEIK